VREAGVRVVREVDGGIVRRVVLLDDAGDEVAPVNRFLSHLTDSAYRTTSAPQPRWSSSATCAGCRPDDRRSAWV
jgi:hypothetical protein